MSTIQTPPQPASDARARSETSTPDALRHSAEERLPSVKVSLGRDAVIDRLRTASKRGRLPGFEAPASGTDFCVAAHGNPFDALLAGTIEHDAIRFELRPLHKLPAIFAIILVATVWPGVYFMDALIPGEWGWIPTWWWYLPITVLPIPWVWRSARRRSRAATLASAHEAIARIAKELDAQVG